MSIRIFSCQKGNQTDCIAVMVELLGIFLQVYGWIPVENGQNLVKATKYLMKIFRNILKCKNPY